MERSVAQTPTTGELKINLRVTWGGVDPYLLRFYTATLELKFNTRNMSNFDGVFETVESLWADLSRNMDDIRYETEGLEREYEELLTLLGVSDHKSAVEAIHKLKSDPRTTSATEKIKVIFAESISKALETEFSKAKTFRDIAGLA